MATKLMTAAGGGITLDAASTATDKTLTLPARTGNVSVDGPAFSVNLTSNQSISAATTTKVAFNSEVFDTNSNFSSSRFTPTVAGYYGISACFGVSSTAAQNIWIAIYKNGSVWQYGSLTTQNAGVGGLNNMAGFVYCNGSTDYIEIYGLSSTAQTLATGAAFTYFNGALVRAA